ncbi:hypothetical protein FZC84_22150 [Rossellomorea vietnamensis]|uniref:Uncharacterized protein n=1 Tax=Rossellomorea vietnamensis TaxID=218284 RepID=A0A5D4M060_9BACI|nr:zinc ribbon domain-containing protein [Rossellomorea vietnamensis]TYR94847.1 hypothetical protein FZC84_22150 [Rossellomorea vietnamensis]
MRYCKQCGSALTEKASFCNNCGEIVSPKKEKPDRRCKSCGKEIGEGLEWCPDCNPPADERKRFCGHCGEKIGEGDQECPICRVTSEQTAYCKSCGTIIASHETFCVLCMQQAPGPGQSVYSPPSTKKRKPRKWFIAVAITAVLMAGGGIYGYFYVQDASSPSHTVEPFIKAVQAQDAAKLSAILKEENPGLKESEVGEFINDLHSHPEVMENALRNMKQQETSLAAGNPFSQPFLFELKQSAEKKWMLIDQYSIDLLPVSFILETDRDARVWINEQEIPPSGTEVRKSADELPGSFNMKAIKDGDYGTFEVTEEMMIWETRKDPIPLYFQEEYVTVTSDAEGAEVFFDGKLYGKIEGADIKIGPVAEGEVITISGKYSYPWGDVFTDDIQAGGSESVDLTFPLNTAAIRTEVIDALVRYNTSYIESITYVDSSLLQNVKGKQLQEMQKTIKNLQQRKITYGGRLDNMIFDGSSFSIEERDGTYFASINVEERYTSSWNDPSDSAAATFIPKKYFFTYYCEYDLSVNEWYVVESKEHKSLIIQDPI